MVIMKKVICYILMFNNNKFIKIYNFKKFVNFKN